ncbi:MAG: CinA family protein [Gammaproteobacteria bacterium]|nr:CinA family protein [Gammaproteobacteria bacterium]
MPVGTCWISWSVKNREIETCCQKFTGDRTHINYQIVQLALSQLIRILKQDII